MSLPQPFTSILLSATQDSPTSTCTSRDQPVAFTTGDTGNAEFKNGINYVIVKCPYKECRTSAQHAKCLLQLSSHVGATLKLLVFAWSVSRRHTVRWRASVAWYGLKKLSSRLQKRVNRPCIDFSVLNRSPSSAVAVLCVILIHCSSLPFFHCSVFSSIPYPCTVLVRMCKSCMTEEGRELVQLKVHQNWLIHQFLRM